SAAILARSWPSSRIVSGIGPERTSASRLLIPFFLFARTGGSTMFTSRQRYIAPRSCKLLPRRRLGMRRRYRSAAHHATLRTYAERAECARRTLAEREKRAPRPRLRTARRAPP